MSSLVSIATMQTNISLPEFFVIEVKRRNHS